MGGKNIPWACVGLQTRSISSLELILWVLAPCYSKVLEAPSKGFAVPVQVDTGQV